MLWRKNQIDTSNLSLIGLLQALGVVVYCVLVGCFFQFMDKSSIEPPGFVGIVLILVLLVISAAITGLLVFGYAAYLAMHEKTKEALTVFAYTILYILGIALVIMTVLLLLPTI